MNYCLGIPPVKGRTTLYPNVILDLQDSFTRQAKKQANNKKKKTTKAGLDTKIPCFMWSRSILAVKYQGQNLESLNWQHAALLQVQNCAYLEHITLQFCSLPVRLPNTWSIEYLELCLNLHHKVVRVHIDVTQNQQVHLASKLLQVL